MAAISHGYSVLIWNKYDSHEHDVVVGVLVYRVKWLGELPCSPRYPWRVAIQMEAEQLVLPARVLKHQGQDKITVIFQTAF